MSPSLSLATLVLVAAIQGASSTIATASPAVQVLRVPGEGIQPQVVTGADGSVYLVYFNGDPAHGDLFYIHSKNGGIGFSAPIQVNSQPGSAVAMGNIRGARLALGKNGVIHVVWNGSTLAAMQNPAGKAPLLYARLEAHAKTFEPQRNLIQTAFGIDGGGALAADALGNVFVFWHAPVPGQTEEANRRVWLAASTDNGRTFAPERMAFDQPTGVCSCCGMDAFVDAQEGVFALFRGASNEVHRAMYLLASTDHGKSFRATMVSPWEVGYCVMSSQAFAQNATHGNGQVFAAWETQKQVLYTHIDPRTGIIAPPSAASGTGVNRKYPALAVNRDGLVLLGWTEGMGWKKGGSAEWQVMDRMGNPVGKPGRAEGVPVWGVIAAFLLPTAASESFTERR